MPFLILVAAAYVAYKNNNSNNDGTNTDSADLNTFLAGKTEIPLLPLERDLANVLELPIVTVSFMQGGSYQLVLEYLQDRVEQIIQANPWLTGRIIQRAAASDGSDKNTTIDATATSQLCLYYDQAAKDRGGKQHFHSFHIASDSSTTATTTTTTSVQFSHETNYHDYADILKDAIVPVDVVGKDHALWQVALIPDAADPEHRFAVIVSLSHIIGDAPTYYKLYNMLSKDATIETLQVQRASNYMTVMEECMGKDKLYYLQDAVARRSSIIMPQHIMTTNHSSEMRLSESISETSPLIIPIQQQVPSDPMVFRMFFVQDEWILHRKGTRESAYSSPCNSGVEGGSSTATVVSANSILSSWFFELNQASIGLIMMDMRQRLDCLADHYAGNYVHGLVCTRAEYTTPGRLQQAVEHLHGISTNDDDEQNERRRRLPPLESRHKTSVSINWTNHARDELYLHEDVMQVMHLPVTDHHLLDRLPNRISMIKTFTACPNIMQTGSERRTGATVICKASVWKQIEESGLVEEMIAEMG